jgi:aspartyl-tRNA(Asn)/glutamyl-tRNA(Gln) amidotransferase subunit A
MRNVAAPLDSPGFNTRNIEADRKAVAERYFGDIDLLVLPTTTARTPAASDVDADPLALSPDNTLFANYYGVPAISVPCGFDTCRTIGCSQDEVLDRHAQRVALIWTD